MQPQPARSEPSINQLTCEILKCAMKVHTSLGPGLLESAYRVCLQHELRKAGFRVDAEVALPIRYDGVELECGYRMDVVVEGKVLLKLKCVEAVTPVHAAQVLSYLKLSGLQVGLLLNFHAKHLRDHLKRFVNGKEWIQDS